MNRRTEFDAFYKRYFEQFCKLVDQYARKKNTFNDSPIKHKDLIKTGLDISKEVCKQVETVFATPIMKNLLVALGDVQQTQKEDGTWSTEKLPTGKESRAVKWVNEFVHACLIKYNGPEKHEYDTTLSIFDKDHLNVDCWNGFKKEIWDIQPGQAEERAELFRQYGDSKTNLNEKNLLNLWDSFQTSLAIELFLAFYPYVRADKEASDVNDTFKHKQTGVSYPWYRNDATIVDNTGWEITINLFPDLVGPQDKVSDLTYGVLAVNIVSKFVKKLYSLPDKQRESAVLEFVKKFDIFTGYPRNQRGKGRALEAETRLVNLLLNLVNRPELEAVQKYPWAIGLRDRDTIKQRLITLGEKVERDFPTYKVYNIDAVKWDLNLGLGLCYLQNFSRMLHYNGDLAIMMAIIRSMIYKKTKLVDGPNNKVHDIFGRQYSGFIDTTIGNTSASRLASIMASLKSDPKAVGIYYSTDGCSVITLGDDLLITTDNINGFRDALQQLGIRLHEDEKDIYGLMFVQERVVRPDNNKPKEYIITYNWPRVLRSTISKEDQKSLGKAGWCLAWRSQLGKLLEYKDGLTIVTNFIYALDKDHLMLDKPVSEIIKMAQEEDNAKLNTLKGNQRKKARSTVEIITGGNPQALGVNEDGSFNANFFEVEAEKLKEVVDPDFFNKLGITLPDISKVH